MNPVTENWLDVIGDICTPDKNNLKCCNLERFAV